MKERYEASLNAFAVLMAGQNEATIRHCLRLREDCTIVAQEMDLSVRGLRDLQYAALLHDIGLFRVSPAVRTKAGPLTEAEWREIHRHPDYGADMVAEITTLERAAEIIRSHHERFDGNGYPRGLAGEDIPLAARVLTVLDAFDSMMRHSAESLEAAARSALEEIQRCAGTQFDPEVVEAFARAHPRLLAQRRAIAGDQD